MEEMAWYIGSNFNLPEGKGLSSPYEEPPTLHP